MPRGASRKVAGVVRNYMNVDAATENHVMQLEEPYHFKGQTYTEVDLNGIADLNSMNESEAENRLARAGFMVTETSFNPTAKFESATIDRKTMEYSYNDGNLYYFMDPETYDLVPIDESALGSNFRFVKENMECTISSYKGKVFQVEPPTFVELEVAETDPGFAGNTATNATKPATLETGAEIKVPLFINPGDRIRVDTRVGEYLERAKG